MWRVDPRGLETEAEDVSACCDDGYRTNLPLKDVTDGGPACIAYELEGEALEPEHGEPAALGQLAKGEDAVVRNICPARARGSGADVQRSSPYGSA